MAELILDYYKNESNYSDGTDVEEEILNMIKSNAHKNPEQLLNASWPVFYHLSPLRENILNWYPFKKNCTILEVGSGCGAITGLLCKMAKSVVSVELTEKRAYINFERHKEYQNLAIYAGNLENMQFSHKFDYIVVNGVLEYAGRFISGGNPYAKFLSILTSYLENNGIILLAIENRLGLKYFSGAKEDHLGKLFAGLDGYANTEIRTFSKAELTDIIHESGLLISKFYYPYPDYKMPEVIYTDEGYLKVPISYNVHSYDTDRYMFFDEIKLQRQLVEENICDKFANSFLVEIRKEVNKKENTDDIIYLKINSNRDKKYKICTVIYKKNNEVKVRKQALEPEAAGHLKKMHEFYKHHDTKNKYGLLPVKACTDALICDYLEFPTLESVLLEQALTNNCDVFFELLDEFYKILSINGKPGKNLYTPEFHNIFGQEICPDDLEFTKFNNIDILFDNVFFNNKKLIVSDYEWIVDCDLPILFIFWRSVNQFYLKNAYINEFLPREQIYNRFNITSNMESIFYYWEYYFSLNYVKMINLEKFQKKIISLSNVERVFDNKYFTANIYIDNGNGFNDNEKYSQKYSIESREVNLTFDLGSFEKIKNIRFDPIEGRLCKCKILSAYINNKECGFTAYNKFPFIIYEEDLFLTTDPIYILNGTYELKGKLDIHFTVEVIGENEIFPNIVKGIEAEIADKNSAIKNYSDLLQKYNDNLLQYNGIKEKYKTLREEYSIISKERDGLFEKIEDLNTDIKNLTNERNDLSEEKNRLLGKIEELNSDIKKLMTERDSVALEYESILNSASWKITKPVRMILDIAKKSLNQLVSLAREIKKLLKKTYWNIKTYGLFKTVKKIFIKGRECLSNVAKSAEIAERVQVSDIWGEIDWWIDNTPHEFIDIFHVPMGWNTPLFQRFQHLSLQAGEVGGISFYGAHPLVDKDIDICEFVTPKLCIVNLDNYEVKQKLFEILDKKKGLKFIRLQSIDLATTIEELESLISRGYKIVYEYIDEITPQIVGSIPQFVFDRHEYILRNEIITVVATADKLFKQVKQCRNQNMALINNGVDYKHWNIEKGQTKCPKDIEEIVNQDKIIIGYHGALAQWIDYELLKIIAEDKRYNILLIGHEHDDNLKKSKILECENVHFIGAKPYQDLPKYAVYYDIAILPFIKNGLTESVSPVKIFEYMALGKPIVTYSLPECKKYRSCLCADTREEFIKNIEYALDLRHDKDYLLHLKNEAFENTWESIMRRTVSLVRENTESRANYINDSEQRISGDIKNNNASVEKDLLAFQSVYINQILRIPDKSNEFVSITNKPYKAKEGDCKIIAYYLTQFHPDEHNEKWWGKGVTEWNNVCRAVPQFVGHYQPRLPGELGFYDLRIRDNMVRQIELAKMYGIYGFSFYYYWFDGIRLLEKPLEAFLSDKTLDFPFSLCWANENWTRRFDGTNLDILMEQPKGKKSYCNVIHDMVRFLKDERYIEIGGKKLITVYRPDLMPEPAEVLKYWREFCREQEAGELYLVAVKVNMVDMDLLSLGYDAISEFHPGTLYTNCKNITNEIEFIHKDFGGEVFDYRDIVENQKYLRYNLPRLYRAVMPMWDNTARRNNKGMIYHGSTPSLYKRWLIDVITEEKNRSDIDDIIVFINAWNEWGEGAYLEPDKRFGYAYLEATKEAVEETR